MCLRSSRTAPCWRRRRRRACPRASGQRPPCPPLRQGDVAVQAGHEQIESDDVVRIGFNSLHVLAFVVERAEPRLDFRKQRVRLSEHILHARHRLYEAVDLRRQLESELLQFRKNRLKTVAGVEGEVALLVDCLDRRLGLGAVFGERGLAGGREEPLYALQDEALVPERRAQV